jgi:hypothetical protein
MILKQSVADYICDYVWNPLNYSVDNYVCRNVYDSVFNTVWAPIDDSSFHSVYWAIEGHVMNTTTSYDDT